MFQTLVTEEAYWPGAADLKPLGDPGLPPPGRLGGTFQGASPPTTTRREIEAKAEVQNNEASPDTSKSCSDSTRPRKKVLTMLITIT